MFEIPVDPHDGLLGVNEALSLRLPRVPTSMTIWRWRSIGSNGVRFPAIRCGRMLMTTLAAVDEFIRLQNEVKE